ncbi:MAG: cytochrome c oxidase assembly protein [Ardenticatenaceae bacterium]|nr:cytochrome c oxidase assembly protein [Ardenticatenaceae bacterium]HBY95970.1 cytochrome c oxidase assembly protein [Chloroflexota bacterium]
MTTWQIFTSAWEWEPSIVVGCVALLVGYLAALRFRPTKAALWFAGGLLVLLLALVSPLDTLGDTYLFSAHMVQHLLLVLIVPPLLLLGIPPSLAERALQWPLAGRAERVLGQPLVAWLVGIVAIWVWHAPALYNAALNSEAIHIAEHLCFLVSATIFWWPVLMPLPGRRLAPLATLLYIVPAAMANTLLGILLAYSPLGLYPAYLSPEDTLGILPLLRDSWGLSPKADQQLAGLLMWVPGGLVYLAALLGVLARWFGSPETDEEYGEATPVDPDTAGATIAPHRRRPHVS